MRSSVCVVCCSELQCVAVCCSVLQCVAVRCVLQCVAVSGTSTSQRHGVVQRRRKRPARRHEERCTRTRRARTRVPVTLRRVRAERGQRGRGECRLYSRRASNSSVRCSMCCRVCRLYSRRASKGRVPRHARKRRHNRANARAHLCVGMVEKGLNVVRELPRISQKSALQ